MSFAECGGDPRPLEATAWQVRGGRRYFLGKQVSRVYFGEYYEFVKDLY